MMRSWESRQDTFVTDEPLYAHYLIEHGLEHPGRSEILKHHESDVKKVIGWLTGEIPKGKHVWYQKHMAHHLVPDVPREWLDQMDHAFLIRNPKDMLTSLIQVLPNPTLEATGLPQQVEIFQRVIERTGKTPPVLDARDVLDEPEASLIKLCQMIGLPFDRAMLSWPRGPRQTDGAWAPHWYASVEKSTGFMRYTAKDIAVPSRLEPLLAEAQILYERLAAHRL